MSRRFLLIASALLVLSCQALSPAAVQTPQVSPSPAPTYAFTPTPFEEAPGFEVLLHPEDGLYIGDLVSFEVISPEDFDIGDREVEIRVSTDPEQTFGPLGFTPFGIGQRNEAIFKWVWDTADLTPGDYQITYSLLPDGPSWNQTITLLPQDTLPLYSQQAHWVSAQTDCCVIHYLTGTAVEREIGQILATGEKVTAQAEAQMGIDLDHQITVVLMPRVLGHGGFAADEIYISFLDRNYAGNDYDQVLLHETIHILDKEIGGDLRPTMFVEGLAVYLSGGHFKPEPLMPRAAALMELGWYVPLAELADNFYFEQHEVGYLEAGALIEYMVDTWGYPAFDSFYRDIRPFKNGSHAEAIDQALQKHFGLTLAELDERYQEALARRPLNPDLEQDVYLTVTYFDAVRRYQLDLDPSAHFLTAWLVYLNEMQQFGDEEDYLRHPDDPANLALETMLINAENQLVLGQFQEAQTTLGAVNFVLTQIEKGNPAPFDSHPLAANYYHIVTLLLDQGYQPQQITLEGGRAQALVYTSDQQVILVTLVYSQDTWSFE